MDVNNKAQGLGRNISEGFSYGYCISIHICRIKKVFLRIIFFRSCLYCIWECQPKYQKNYCQNREKSHANISNYWKRLWFVVHGNHNAYSHDGKKTNDYTSGSNFFFRYGVISSFINWCVTSKVIPTALSLIWRCFHGARSEIKNLAYQYSRKAKVFHESAASDKRLVHAHRLAAKSVLQQLGFLGISLGRGCICGSPKFSHTSTYNRSSSHV